MSEARCEVSADNSSSSPRTLMFAAPLMGAAAGAMGWGIRGQYGHEWGAMVPGALVAFALVFLFCRHSSSLFAARAIALAAVGFSFGGTMTYGQTIGLTQDPVLIGNYDALRWGMLGLFVKGAIWIGFGGAFLGMGLSGKPYRSMEMILLFALMLLLVFVGIQLLNRPYVPGSDRDVAWYYFPKVPPGDRALPWIYFSDHWHWEPDNQKLDPRPEVWGGLLMALLGLLAYVSLIKNDRLARNMTLFGLFGGGLGFSLGQCLQAGNAWSPDWLARFERSLHHWMPGIFPEAFFSLMTWNWWNMMETTFGAVMGFVLGLGLWWNRTLVAERSENDSDTHMSPHMEWPLILVHTTLLYLWSVPRYDRIDILTGFPMTMGLLPTACVVSGRYWPYMQCLPLVALPIAGITWHSSDRPYYLTDGLLLMILPLGVMTWAAFSFERRGRTGQDGRTLARYGLVLSAFTYFALNFVFFGFPWATMPVGVRHTNSWIFLRCVEFLTFSALLLHRAASVRTQGKATV